MCFLSRTFGSWSKCVFVHTGTGVVASLGSAERAQSTARSCRCSPSTYSRAVHLGQLLSASCPRSTPDDVTSRNPGLKINSTRASGCIDTGINRHISYEAFTCGETRLSSLGESLFGRSRYNSTPRHVHARLQKAPLESFGKWFDILSLTSQLSEPRAPEHQV